MMKRNTINFILNLVSFLVLLGLIITGTIIAMPHKHGPGEKSILGLGSGQWDDVHLWFGVTFAVLMVIHIILHWDWVKCYVKSVFRADEVKEN